jgi:succinate dehydrogenase assembly factor 2
LDENDWDTYYWATGKKTPPERWAQSPLFEGLKVHARNEGNVIRRISNLEMARVQEL